MSEENKASETTPAEGEAASASDKAQKKIDYLAAHEERWHRRMQMIAAVVAVFLLYMIWFMMHE